MTIDTIQLPVRTITSIGGPPCYAGLVCSRFGNKVSVLTRIGPDFPEDQIVWLSRNGITLHPGDRSAKQTTRFKLDVQGAERKLYLLARCDDLTVDQLPDSRFDASLISPIAQEISGELLQEIVRRSDFTFLDPQGFVRSFDAAGLVSITRPRDPDLFKSVSAIKMDREEANALTGKDEPKEALTKLAGKGVRKAMVTQGSDSCYVLDGNRIHSIPVPKVQIVDTTGAGDILGGALIASYMRSRDFLWSAAFGVAASSMSLNLIALSKVDLPRSVDEQAKRLYSLASPIATV